MTEEQKESLRRMEEKNREIDYTIDKSIRDRKNLIRDIEDVYINDLAEILSKESDVWGCKVHLHDFVRKIKDLNK